MRDIQTKHKLRNTLLLEKLVDFLSDNIGNLTSIRKISGSFSTNNKAVSHITIRNYIDYLTKAFAFYKIRRYDIQGKKYLSTIDKYYLSDHSFKYAKLGTKNMNYGRIYENIIAIELLRRGYEIYVGTLYKKEIDFVAIKRNEKIYIQVCDNLENEKTLKGPKDSFTENYQTNIGLIRKRLKTTNLQIEDFFIGKRFCDIFNNLSPRTVAGVFISKGNRIFS